jgi:septal ring factor EnvC (AmiA/AmiB activator)
MVGVSMKKTGIILILIFVSGLLCAQEIEELRNQKKRASEEIEFTNKLLEKVKSDEKASLNKLRLLENKIEQRNKIISVLNSESSLIINRINDNSQTIEKMKEQLEAIKQEYAGMIRQAYRTKGSTDLLFFLISSNDFNQAYKRYLYFKQYSDYRKNQAARIVALQDSLARKTSELQSQKAEKDILIQSQQTENKQLGSEKKQQNSYLQKMQKEQSTLRQKLREQQRLAQEIDRKIQQIIDEETRKSGGDSKAGFALTPEQKLVGNSFGQNKGRLPWPVERGVITEHFGLQKHQTLKEITLNNSGIEITTEPNAKARAVFNGEVTRVFAISGANMGVILRHGQYLTVYLNLRDVTVKQGDKVETKQNIGTIYTDNSDGDKTILKFQVRNEKEKLDPESWIVR